MVPDVEGTTAQTIVEKGGPPILSLSQQNLLEEICRASINSGVTPQTGINAIRESTFLGIVPTGNGLTSAINIAESESHFMEPETNVTANALSEEQDRADNESRKENSRNESNDLQRICKRIVQNKYPLVEMLLVVLCTFYLICVTLTNITYFEAFILIVIFANVGTLIASAPLHVAQDPCFGAGLEVAGFFFTAVYSCVDRSNCFRNT